MKTWIVEKAREFTTVEADTCTVDMSGALVFQSGNLSSRELIRAIAHGEWLDVEPHACAGDDDDGESE